MFKSISDFIKTVQHAFHDSVHDILAGLDALANSIARNGGAVLLTAAAVAAAEASGGKGSDKLKAAQAAVIATLTAKGLPVVMNAINGAIEAAVAQHNANLVASNAAA